MERPPMDRMFPQEEGVQWIPSACGMCYAQCSIMAKVKNGVVMKIEGNPYSSVGNGRLCPKGVSAIMTLYDPHRVNVPLMRTNPKKGKGIDPGWKEITWDEANKIIVEKLKAIKADDPRKMSCVRTTTISTPRNVVPWMQAFGSPNSWAAGGGLHCGNGAHLLGGQFHASWSLVPDFSRCDLAMYFGASKGHAAGHSSTSTAQQVAEARARGMKMVVVDPMDSYAASKSSEWVPIRVGTDAALALGMVNIIVNEMGIWDAEYIQRHTNGGYLIKSDGLYVRDPVTSKPLVWDATAGETKAYDDPTATNSALIGEYEVNGVKCRPSFQCIKDHVKKYTPEYVEKITTIPAARVRELATDFGTRARVGATVEIDGYKLPFRPVAAIYFRGAQGHKNCTYNCLAIELLNQVVGASDVPGGALGFNPTMHGHPESGRPYYQPFAGPDGLMVVGTWLAAHKPYPPHDPHTGTLNMTDVWPLTMLTGIQCATDREEIWSAFKVPYRCELMLNIGANPVLTVGNPDTVTEAMSEIPFTVSFELCLTEYSELADIILPDKSTYERLDAGPQWPPLHDHPAGPGDWSWPVRFPLIDTVGQRRDFQEVFLEWAYACGFGDDYHAHMNLWYGFQGEYALQPGVTYTWEEINQRRVKTMFGEKHGLEWFRANQGVMRWPKTVKEVYWRYFVDARAPLYYEQLKRVGASQRQLFAEHNFDHKIDWSRFEPMPEWTPCCSHEEKRAEYDCFAFYYRDVLTTNSFTYENPWLDEVARENPFSFNIAMNRTTAEKKGLQSGDWVVMESAKGRKAPGRLIVTDLIHPEALGVAGCGGHYTKHQPIAMGKGVRFNELLEIDLEHMDPVSLNLDLCVKVKVYKDPEKV